MVIQTIKDSSLTYKQTKECAVKLSNGHHQPSKVFQKTGPNTWTEVWVRTLPSYNTFAFRNKFFDNTLHDFIVQCLNLQVNVRYTFLR